MKAAIEDSVLAVVRLRRLVKVPPRRPPRTPMWFVWLRHDALTPLGTTLRWPAGVPPRESLKHKEAVYK